MVTYLSSNQRSKILRPFLISLRPLVPVSSFCPRLWYSWTKILSKTTRDYDFYVIRPPLDSEKPQVSKENENVCEVSADGKISDCQPEGPGFNPRP